MSILSNYDRYKALTTTGINENLIYEIFSGFWPERFHLHSMHSRYRADHLPIKKRDVAFNKINNKLNHDFFGEIVDTKVGYMVGYPVIYTLEGPSKEYQAMLEIFLKRNDVADLDSDTLTAMAICGKSYRLLHVDTDGNRRVKHLEPWDVCYVTDPSDNCIFALTICQLDTDVYKLYAYDSQFVREYMVSDSLVTPVGSPIPHMFQSVPVIKFVNNKEEQGDCDKVMSLIDAYDRIDSDLNSELEQMRLAYLALLGADFEEEDIEKFKKTGVISLPDGTDAKWLNKELKAEAMEKHMSNLSENILRFAKSVNFTDKDFGVISGVALKFKVQSLENKALKTERKFGVGIREMFRVLAPVWSLSGANINYLDVDWVFRRNVPEDYQSEAQANAMLKGLVSEEARLGQLSFVGNPRKELERMQKELAENPGLDNYVTPDSATSVGDGI